MVVAAAAAAAAVVAFDPAVLAAVSAVAKILLGPLAIVRLPSEVVVAVTACLNGASPGARDSCQPMAEQNEALTVELSGRIFGNRVVWRVRPALARL